MTCTKNKQLLSVEKMINPFIVDGNRGARLLQAMELQPQPPCVNRGDGKACEFFRRCASELQACAAFYAYTRQPTYRPEYREWRQMARDPSTKIYGKMLREGDVSP